MNTQKGFSKILAIVIGLIVIGGLSYYINSKLFFNIEREVGQENDVQTPEDVLKDYYTNIIKRLNQETKNDVSLDSRYVTNNVIKKVNELKNEYPDGIPANPFICAQDFPDDMSNLVFKQISTDDNSAKFEVYAFPKPIVVYLVKDKVWKIDEINCNR